MKTFTAEDRKAICNQAFAQAISLGMTKLKAQPVEGKATAWVIPTTVGNIEVNTKQSHAYCLFHDAAKGQTLTNCDEAGRWDFLFEPFFSKLSAQTDAGYVISLLSDVLAGRPYRPKHAAPGRAV